MSIHYLAEHYGEEAVKTVLQKTGRDVYKSIHDKLVEGDASELIEHLVWFTCREGGKFKLEVNENEIRFEMLDCPAIKHLRKLGIKPDALTCLQTSEVNAGMCAGSPWTTSTEIISEGHCVQIFKKAGEK
ncbi:MAG: hypothetical protein PHV59_13130 [Victivallales bacterium]|nr:hypothetical protein [Victivallales bacterium]